MIRRSLKIERCGEVFVLGIDRADKRNALNLQHHGRIDEPFERDAPGALLSERPPCTGC